MLAVAQAERIDQVKSAFVLNIARFVTWPPDALAGQPRRLRVCLYRDNPLSAAMQRIEGKRVGGQRIQVDRVASLAGGASCQILLVSPKELDAYRRDAVHSPVRPLLTIADLTAGHGADTGRRHILLALVRNGTRIGFEINLKRVRESGLKMSSKLLKLAKIVDDGGD